MGTVEPIITPPRIEPGVGKGWTVLAEAVARDLDIARLARIWVFAPIRRNEREWGTAVLALRAEGDRLEIHTARYYLITRGKKRGESRVEVTAVAESPADVVSDVLDSVQERTGEPDAPVEIDPVLWFPEEPEEDSADDDEPAPEG